jgi:membrane-associated PAP2 superfamily phosphatase
MIPISITVGMLGYGLVTDDIRSLQTSSQLAEGLLSVAVVVQTIKRTTGRQTPGAKTESGGKWQFFPNVKEYTRNTPSYDAFPSGHLATAMMTITVLGDNYPEYTLIKPVGYGLMTLLGFQMINNGVHWASDYPIAIAIGYGIGKVAVSRGRKVVSTEKNAETTSKQSFIKDLTMLPLPIENGGALFVMGKF